MIRAEGLSKSYGQLEILKGVSLFVGPKEVVSITGPSGAGKSTLLQLLGSLDKPTAGKVFYDDQDLSDLSKKKLARFRNLNIGFVFQFHHLLPEFTALENICIPGFIAGRKRQEVIKEARDLLSRFGLSQRMEHKPSQLSGGEQQRVAVARALINKPKVIFADEPSGNLDTENANMLHQIFFDLRDELDQSFVIVTHNLELAKMADRTVKMKDGRILV